MKITILTFSSAFLPFFWPAFLSMGHQWCVPQPQAGSRLGGHTGWWWLCLPVVLHLLGRGAERDKWINHSLLVSLPVWQIRGVPITGCGIVAASGSFPLEENMESLPLFLWEGSGAQQRHIVMLGPTSSDCLAFQTLFSWSANGWMLGVFLRPGAFCSQREIGNQGLYSRLKGNLM